MPLVTARPIGQSNGDVVTEFVDVADTGVTTWTYSTTQNSLNFTNRGKQDITVTVASNSYTVNPGASRVITADFTSFTTQSASKTQEFKARTIVNATPNGVDPVARALAAQKSDKTYVDNQLAAVNAGPRGVYATLAALQAAFPTGDTYNKLVTADNKWYYWNGSAWTAGNVYQATSPADGSIKPRHTDFPYVQEYKNEGYEGSYASPFKSGVTGTSITNRFSSAFKTFSAGTYFVYYDFNISVVALTEAYMLPSILRSSGGSYDVGVGSPNSKIPIYSQISSQNNIVAYGFVTLSADESCALGLNFASMNAGTKEFTLVPNKVYCFKISSISDDLLKSLSSYSFSEYIPVLAFPNQFATRTELQDATKNQATFNYDIFDQAYIKAGGLIANNDHPNSSNIIAKYTFADLGENAVTVKAKVKFKGDSNPTLLATPNGMNKVSDITNTSLHINFSASLCRVQFFNKPTYPSIQDVTSFNYSGIDTTGQTEYEIGWSLSGNTLTVFLPDGTTRIVTNDNFPIVVGRYVCWEHFFTTAQQGNIFTQFYAVGSTKPALVDNFLRFDGAIGIAPSGQKYVQFRNDN